MKPFILAVICASFIACNQPPRGDDPVRRDSIDDPIDSMDTAGIHHHPDTVRDTSKLEF